MELGNDQIRSCLVVAGVLTLVDAKGDVGGGRGRSKMTFDMDGKGSGRGSAFKGE
jgi:hypothetical protein